MRHRLAIAAAATAVAAALAVTGCAPTASPTGAKTSSTPVATTIETPTPSATVAPTPTVKPKPTAEPTSTGVLVVSPTKVAFTTSGKTTTADLGKGKDVVALFAKAAGKAPAGKKGSSDYGTFTTYDFGSAVVTVADGDYANVRVLGAKLNGSTIKTAGGFHVGSVRKDLMAGGAQDGGDADGDGLADILRVDIKDAPGTSSLENPGTTGIDFVMLLMDGDSVKTIMVPANDYSDL